MCDTPSRRRGFTLLEFLVALGILAILIAIILPFTLSVRENERRTRCMDNLRKLADALTKYGGDNRYELPRVIYNEREMPHAYTAYSGPDASDPFALPVKPNDITASLWLLVRGNYISSVYSPATSAFICPSSGDLPDQLTDAAGQHVGPRERANFRGPLYLSYSYASPFSNAPGYGLKSDFLPPNFVLMSDKNPGKVKPTQDVTGPGADAGPLVLKAANSRNHGRAGQSVLFGDMHVEFSTTPYCGVGGDNIYTAVAAEPIMTGEAPDPRSHGFVGPKVGPAWPTDTYLVPSESDE